MRDRLSGAALARSVFLNLVGTALPLLVALAAIPVIIEGLGVARFGLLVLAWIVLDYAALLDLGLGRASTRYIADAIGRGHTQDVPDIVWTSLVLQVVSGIVGGAALMVAAPLIVDHGLSVQPDLRDTAVGVLRLVGLAIPVVLFSGTMRGVLEASQRFGVVNAIRAPFGVVSYLVAALGAWLGWSLVTIVALLVAGRVLSLLLFTVHAQRTFQGLLRPRRPAIARYGGMARFGGWVTVSSVVSPALVYIERFVIGALRGMPAVGIYSAPAEVMRRLLTLPTAIVLTLFPAISTLRAGADRERVDRLIPRAIRFLLLTVGPVAIVLSALAPELLGAWLGAAFTGDAVTVLRVLALGVLVNALAFIPYIALEAAGRPDVPARLHLLELPLYLAATWLLVREWGVVGAAAAWSLRVGLDALLLMTAAARIGVVPMRALRSQHVPAAALLVAAMAVAATLAVVFLEATTLRVAAVVALFAATLPLGWLLLDANERAGLLGVLRR